MSAIMAKKLDKGPRPTFWVGLKAWPINANITLIKIFGGKKQGGRLAAS